MSEFHVIRMSDEEIFALIRSTEIRRRIMTGFKMYWIHKHSVRLEYGGREEGGWWFTAGVPTGFVLGPIVDEENAYAQSRALNEQEEERRLREEKYDFTSVLSHESNHYSYTVEEFSEPYSFPDTRPHYC